MTQSRANRVVWESTEVRWRKKNLNWKLIEFSKLFVDAIQINLQVFRRHFEKKKKMIIFTMRPINYYVTRAAAHRRYTQVIFRCRSRTARVHLRFALVQVTICRRRCRFDIQRANQLIFFAYHHISAQAQKSKRLLYFLRSLSANQRASERASKQRSATQTTYKWRRKKYNNEPVK